MTDETSSDPAQDGGAADPPESSDWLIEPVTAQGWKVYVAIGEESGLPDDVIGAVEELMRTLQEHDVTIYTDGGIMEAASSCTKCSPKCTKCDKDSFCWTKWFIADPRTFGFSE